MDGKKCMNLIKYVAEEEENYTNLYDGLTKALAARDKELKETILFLMAVVNDLYTKSLIYKEKLSKLEPPKEEKKSKKGKNK